MPPRTSSRSRAVDGHVVRKAIVYHGTAVTLLSVVSLFLFLGISLALLASVARMERAERMIASQEEEIRMLRLDVTNAKPTTPSNELPTTTQPTTPPSLVPSAPTAPGSTTSPSGKLTRGSLSPDGSKFAGYEETTKGKIGVAVEMVSGGRIRYIVIFNPYTESTGAGTELANTMSVRWVDAQTIEYDVLVTRGGTQAKETEQVRIFF